MPTMIQTISGKVTGLWGKAMIQGPDGKMRPLKIGDLVVKGDVILTSQDGIVQLNPDAVVAGGPKDEIDIEPAAGAGGGSLLDGLRVDRIVETTTDAEIRPDGVLRPRSAARLAAGDQPGHARRPSPVHSRSTRTRCCRCS